MIYCVIITIEKEMVIKLNKESHILISFLINAKMQTYANEKVVKTCIQREIGL